MLAARGTLIVAKPNRASAARLREMALPPGHMRWHVAWWLLATALASRLGRRHALSTDANQGCGLAS